MLINCNPNMTRLDFHGERVLLSMGSRGALAIKIDRKEVVTGEEVPRNHVFQLVMASDVLSSYVLQAMNTSAIVYINDCKHRCRHRGQSIEYKQNTS